MKIKGNGRSALILVAGLWVCFAGPSPAAAGNEATTASSTAGAPIALNKYTRHGSRHWRRYAHHSSSKVAVKSTDDKDDKKAAATDVTATDADKSRAAIIIRHPADGRQRQGRIGRLQFTDQRRCPGDVGASQQYRAERAE